MTWAKIDTAIHRNPKVRMAGRDARDVYMLILLANAEKKADGELTGYYAEPVFLADALQCTEEQARNGLKQCETFHLLQVTDGVVRILGWDDEWKTPKSTDRVRKHRETKRSKQKQEVEPNETRGNVSVTIGNAETPRAERVEQSRESKCRAKAQASEDASILALTACEELNTLTQSNYHPTSKATLKLCSALAKDGITPKQIEGVIRFKVREWSSDPKMSKYLAPATLLANENFHKYLDAARSAATRPKRREPVLMRKG